MSVFQVLIIIFIAFVIFKAVRRCLKNEISALLCTFWIFFWLIIALIAIFPIIINRVADIVGVGRGVDLIIYVSVFVLFYLVFKIYIRLNKIDKSISEIIRKIAISDVYQDKKEK